MARTTASSSLSLLLVGLSLAGALPVGAPASAAPVVPSALAVQSGGRVEYGEFQSPSLGRGLRYAVSLPPSYDRESSRRYPVVIFLHGLFNSEKDWQERGVQAALEQLRASGKVGEFVVALPFGANSFYLNGKDGTRYEDAVVKDFIPYVDKTYRTTATPRERVIGGISMGGFGALVIAFKHPQLFSGVAAHSAALFEELPRVPANPADRRAASRYQMASRIFGDPPDQQFFQDNNPLDLAASNAAKLKSLKIYFDVGESDRYGFADGNRKLDAALTKAGIQHTFHAAPGDHGWAFLVGRIEPAMTFVWGALGGK